MDALMLSRLQFAVTTIFHFLFVPLTLGLSLLIAILETQFVRTGDEDYRKLAKFFGKLFLINFATGIVTGITLEFQFGTNWSKYSKFVGDVFGSLLAIEASAAFFLEATFIAVWAFGWKKLSPKKHALAIWLVAISSNLSAIWILIANAWMQHPVGHVIRNGRAEVESFMTIVLQPHAWMTIAHTVLGAFILAGFFVMGISSYHLLKKNHVQQFRKAFRLASVFTLGCSLLVAMQGHLHAMDVAKYQPVKLAAMESLWETQKMAPMHLLAFPNESAEKNSVEFFAVPGVLSILAYGNPNAEVKGLKDFPKEDRPPVTLTFLSFRAMVGLGTLFIFLAAIAAWYSRRIEIAPDWLFKVLLFSIPLPYLACEFGWMVAEIGRQPWVVYGIMRTRDAVSNVPASSVAVSLVAFIGLYSLLAGVNFYLLVKAARRGLAGIKE